MYACEKHVEGEVKLLPREDLKVIVDINKKNKKEMTALMFCRDNTRTTL